MSLTANLHGFPITFLSTFVLSYLLFQGSLQSLLLRGWREYKVPLIDSEERLRMIQAFFELYRKTLRTDLKMQLAKAPEFCKPALLEDRARGTAAIWKF